MSKIHYFQRYSSVENTVTNNTLQLLARIYDYSTSRASNLLTEITGEPIEIGIEINQQERAGDSVPDGVILQRSFKILIESKVDSGVNEDQLFRHAKSFSHETQQILLLLTKQKIDSKHEKELTDSISKKNPSVVFKNVTYETICSALHDLFADYENEMQALANDYVEYCNDACLFDQSQYLMRIVPCGKSLKINQKHGVYFHPTDRGYTKHQFVGIYKDKAVQTLWDIDSVYDVDYDGNSLTKTLIQGRDTPDYDDKIISIIQDAKTECGYEISTDHRFFCGNPIDTNYVKSSPYGIQGARFINLKDVIGDHSDTQEVANKLRNKQWT